MKRIVLIAAAVAMLAGCEPTPSSQQRQMAQDVAIPTFTQQRITVERIGVFNDSLAYHGERGICLVKDSETGKEFIGISGVGISELGSHSSGKTRRTDER